MRNKRIFLLISILLFAVLAVASPRKAEPDDVLKPNSISLQLIENAFFKSHLVLKIDSVIDDSGDSLPSSPNNHAKAMILDNTNYPQYDTRSVIIYNNITDTWEVLIADMETVPQYIYFVVQENAFGVWDNGELKGAMKRMGEAGDVYYDNSSSGLSADNVQDAIDEIASENSGTSTQQIEWKTFDGSDNTMTLSYTPSGKVQVLLDGTVLQQGGTDFTLSGNTITFSETASELNGRTYAFVYIH